MLSELLATKISLHDIFKKSYSVLAFHRIGFYF
jgi:hypothetical protein